MCDRNGRIRESIINASLSQLQLDHQKPVVGPTAEGSTSVVDESVCLAGALDLLLDLAIIATCLQ